MKFEKMPRGQMHKAQQTTHTPHEYIEKVYSIKRPVKTISRDEAVKQRCIILINSCTINMQLYFVRTKINTAIRRLTNKNFIKEISEAFENKKNQLTTE